MKLIAPKIATEITTAIDNRNNTTNAKTQENKCVAKFIDWKLATCKELTHLDKLTIQEYLYKIVAILEAMETARKSNVFQYLPLKIALYKDIVLLRLNEKDMLQLDQSLKHIVLSEDNLESSFSVNAMLDNLKDYLLHCKVNTSEIVDIKKLLLVSFISTLCSILTRALRNQNSSGTHFASSMYSSTRLLSNI